MSSEQKALKELGKNIKGPQETKWPYPRTVSELCEFDPTYISLLERGKRNPAFFNSGQDCQAFEV
jgi:hypothetical protein